MHLSGFETEWKRAVGMQTRRVSLLSPLYEQLNKNVFIVLCKELSFECGQALQSVQDVHEMRLNQLEKGSKKFISAMKKADKAGVEAMVHFSRFLTHFLTKEGTDPEFGARRREQRRKQQNGDSSATGDYPTTSHEC